MGSVTANLPDPQMLAVGAARSAVSNISRALAAECAEEGINVNTINLGAIGTQRQRDKYAGSRSTVSFEEWSDQEAALRRIPMGRFGRPSEVAPLVAMLVSPLAMYITGTSIDVTGGMGCSL